MSDDILEIKKKAVLENFKSLDRVLFSGFVLSILVVLTKIIDPSLSIEWGGIDFQISKIWIVFLLLTCAHLFFAAHAVRSIKHLDGANTKFREKVFAEVTATGGVFCRGLVSRIIIEGGPRYSISYKMSFEDLSTWISYSSILLLFLSLIPLDINYLDVENTRIAVWQILIALTFVNINWLIGTNWAVALSSLELDSTTSFYFEIIKGKKVMSEAEEPIFYSRISPEFKQIKWYNFPVWFFMQTINLFMLIPIILIRFFVFLIRRVKNKVRS